ncbi:hypothetical protein SKAU_G00188720 [Synaphobranchus kaupii]|uniref:Uncharacterized protein n=1 Tax=Synaphobranchus kaupii TaxID=118154 RepID=A0A9Q1IX10_SYNKA|nr:hypothetical protein SKAU_G00188720 [Synaphobranchus kaupii]
MRSKFRGVITFWWSFVTSRQIFVTCDVKECDPTWWKAVILQGPRWWTCSCGSSEVLMFGYQMTKDV